MIRRDSLVGSFLGRVTANGGMVTVEGDTDTIAAVAGQVADVWR